jgi:hypothetical protein
MGLNLFGMLDRSASARRPASSVARHYFRPRLDALEDRVVLDASGLALPLDIDVNLVNQAAGPVLEAVFTLAGGEVGTATFDVTTLDDPNGECPILNLEIGAIDLNLLGLGVETSDICLDITAIEGGGLLGDLLCDLSTGLNLGQIIEGFGDQIDTLIDGINDLLDQAIGEAQNGGGGVTAQQDGVVDILNLELGPVDLTLLGLNIELDDCADGPVTVDVTADPSGGLLGQLLAGLGGLDLDDLGDRIGDLIGRVGDILDQVDDLPGNVGDRIERLLDQLQGAAGRIDSLRDLDRFLDRADRTLDRIDRLIDRTDDLSGLQQAIRRLEAAIDRVEDLIGRLEDLLDDNGNGGGNGGRGRGNN